MYNIMDKKEQNNLGDIFDKHIEFEFDKEDVNATMTTMTDVLHVPILTGGSSYNGAAYHTEYKREST